METQHLDIELRLDRPDDFYEALVDMHRGLDEAQSRLVNAKLILLLSNQVGDLAVLREAMAVAREDVLGPDSETELPPQP
ncbi:DUF2783 domain-containing protein [Ectothiorhodospiraceae bacterium WFHF3C12]|nr:DUF2783 domain-containing protein [Ectothiorhodospiraceae bacterium WFHF3C12]